MMGYTTYAKHAKIDTMNELIATIERLQERVQKTMVRL